MAEELQNEEEIYNRIRNEHILVDHLIWQLLNHHLRNDLQVIMLEAEELRGVLYEIACNPIPGDDFSLKLSLLAKNIIQRCDIILARGRSISGFLADLKSATAKESEVPVENKG